MSGAGVLQALLARGVDAHAFDPAQRPLNDLQRDGYARCFIALHGRHGEDGTVQGALELMGIPYTGPGVMASSIAMDKIMTKRLWRADGLPTPDWRLVTSPEDTVLALQALGSPMIVKPAREGSTLGLTKVATPEECAEAYALASRYDPEVLCEQFIDGDETTCPILGAGAGAHALPVIRINTTAQVACRTPRSARSSASRYRPFVHWSAVAGRGPTSWSAPATASRFCWKSIPRRA